MIRVAVWVVSLIILAIIGPPIYHAAGAAYFKHHLQSVTDSVTKDCGGPITDSMGDYQKGQVNTCISSNQELAKAQADYDNFTKSGK